MAASLQGSASCRLSNLIILALFLFFLCLVGCGNDSPTQNPDGNGNGNGNGNGEGGGDTGPGDTPLDAGDRDREDIGTDGGFVGEDAGGDSGDAATPPIDGDLNTGGSEDVGTPVEDFGGPLGFFQPRERPFLLFGPGDLPRIQQRIGGESSHPIHQAHWHRLQMICGRIHLMIEGRMGDHGDGWPTGEEVQRHWPLKLPR